MGLRMRVIARACECAGSKQVYVARRSVPVPSNVKAFLASAAFLNSTNADLERELMGTTEEGECVGARCMFVP